MFDTFIDETNYIGTSFSLDTKASGLVTITLYEDYMVMESRLNFKSRKIGLKTLVYYRYPNFENKLKTIKNEVSKLIDNPREESIDYLERCLKLY